MYASSLGKFDNKNPRTYTKETEGDQTIDKGTERAQQQTPYLVHR